MTLQPGAEAEFLAIFDEAGRQIRRFPGCKHLELWQDDKVPNIFVSYSCWSDTWNLEQYRSSALFLGTWSKVKPLFAARAEAFSAHCIRTPGQDITIMP